MQGWEWHRSTKLSKMLESHIKGELDTWTDKEVRRTLFRVRFRQAAEPWINLIKRASRFLWEQTYGRYRESRAKSDGGANPTPSVGAGTTLFYTSPNAPTQFTGFATATTPPPLGPIEDAGIRAGEIVGYRCWQIDSAGLLRSVFRSESVWLPGEVMVGSPDVSTSEGVHAFKDRLAAGAYGYNSLESGLVIGGTVDMWGMVIEHERGYRAQYAAIASIDDSPFYDAKSIRKRYGLTKRRKKKVDKPAKPE
jgi:hypothetical protein